MDEYEHSQVQPRTEPSRKPEIKIALQPPPKRQRWALWKLHLQRKGQLEGRQSAEMSTASSRSNEIASPDPGPLRPLEMEKETKKLKRPKRSSPRSRNPSSRALAGECVSTLDTNVLTRLATSTSAVVATDHVASPQFQFATPSASSNRNPEQLPPVPSSDSVTLEMSGVDQRGHCHDPERMQESKIVPLGYSQDASSRETTFKPPVDSQIEKQSWKSSALSGEDIETPMLGKLKLFNR